MKLSAYPTLEEILEYAIVASWKDLTHAVQTGLMHIEYNLAAGGTLDNLGIWSSITRGHWLLVCEYWMSASNSHPSGVRFENGYHSEGLAHTLELVMQHQNVFAPPHNLAPPGLLQIPHPTESEIATAAASIREAFAHVSSALAEPVLV
jgi:hypothetical protein